MVDEIQKEIKSFLNIFNNAFEAHQLHSQHTAKDLNCFVKFVVIEQLSAEYFFLLQLHSRKI